MIKLEIVLSRETVKENYVKGNLQLPSGKFLRTLERPWKNNEPFLSCIPTGLYKCKRFHSQKFGNTFEVTGVSGRDAILFHSGNVVDDTHGCILLGCRNGGSGAILESKKAMELFLEELKEVESFDLWIL